MILTDDQGYGDLSINGNTELQTPNIDRLGRDGVRLEDFHMDPTCSPSRAALMTGRYSARTGVWLTFGGRNHLRRAEMTMADVFKHNGYATGIFGKWHLGDNYPFRPQDRGFDKSVIHGGVAGEVPDVWGNDYFDDTYFVDGLPTAKPGYTTDVWFDEAIEFIDQQGKKPFFAYIPVNTPHGPYNVEPALVQPYLDAGIEEGRARFYAMIGTSDSNVGRLYQHLNNKDLLDNTLIVYANDNGTTAGFLGKKTGWARKGHNGGMRGKKGTAYEGGHRAAGFLHWPAGLPKGHSVDQLSMNFDLLPTMVDLFGLRMPRDVKLDGKSLVPLLTAPNSEVDWPERRLFVQDQGRFGQPVHKGLMNKYQNFVVMTEQWRLVNGELYDIQKDPSQRNDIARQYPEVVRVYLRRMKCGGTIFMRAVKPMHRW